MGLVCVSCGLRFYLPPGEQVWLEKHCGGSIFKPGLPQYCIECMERRFSRPVSKANQTASRDGAVRMPTGEKEDVCSYAQEPIRWRTPQHTRSSSWLRQRGHPVSDPRAGPHLLRQVNVHSQWCIPVVLRNVRWYKCSNIFVGVFVCVHEYTQIHMHIRCQTVLL